MHWVYIETIHVLRSIYLSDKTQEQPISSGTKLLPKVAACKNNFFRVVSILIIKLLKRKPQEIKKQIYDQLLTFIEFFLVLNRIFCFLIKNKTAVTADVDIEHFIRCSKMIRLQDISMLEATITKISNWNR